MMKQHTGMLPKHYWQYNECRDRWDKRGSGLPEPKTEKSLEENGQKWADILFYFRETLWGQMTQPSLALDRSIQLINPNIISKTSEDTPKPDI